MSHPAEALNETVHQRTRLGILAVLAEAGRVQFGFLKETLGLTDGNLSRHLTILEDAGYVKIEKGYEGKRPRTWVMITKRGRVAFDAEMAALKDLVLLFDGLPTATPSGERQPATKPVSKTTRTKSTIRPITRPAG